MFPLFVVAFPLFVGDGFDQVVNEIAEDGIEGEALRRIDFRIVNVVQFGDEHACQHLAGNVFFVHALLHPFLDVDFDFFVDEIGTQVFMYFKDFRKVFG